MDPDKNIIVFADTREVNSRIIHILKKFCDVREKQLAVGDYLPGGDVCVERKSSSDFVQSIIDQRLFKQLDAMKHSYTKPVLIVEGPNVLDCRQNVHPNALRGALSSIALDYTIPIIWTETQMDTAHQILAIAKREQAKKGSTISIRPRKKARSIEEMQEFLVCGIPKISTQKAQALLKHFKTPENIFTATEAELGEAEGIGKELARQIRSLLTREYE